MPTEAEILQFLRHMKGARLAIPIACQPSGAYHGNLELRRWTGYKGGWARPHLGNGKGPYRRWMSYTAPG